MTLRVTIITLRKTFFPVIKQVSFSRPTLKIQRGSWKKYRKRIKYRRRCYECQEKEDFIKSHSEIYFPAIGITSIQWLKSVIEQIKEAI